MSPRHNKLVAWLLPLALSLPNLCAAEPGDKIYQEGFLSIEESHESIELPNGYRLELLLTEPIVEEPVMAAWDGNGAMYVVQMRSYMQDVDASGEKDPTSVITRHVDSNGDGTYDKHSIFAKDLVLPRFVLPLDDRVVVGMTGTLDLWTYRDTTGDSVCDEIVKIYEGGSRGGNMEHQPSGLMWSLDNWMYLTYEAKRYRFTEGKFISEDIPRGSGQWGLTQDDWGRQYFSDAGGEKPAIDYQQPLAYGGMNLSGQQDEDFSTIHPIAEVPDVQGGSRRVGPNGGVNHFTGVAGQSIFRGDRLPKELYGSLMIPEPVGRLIRQATVDRKDAKSVLRNATPGSEFIRTRDVNFRPVWTATTPSGQMLIVDMHRGIIQQGNWTKKGTYLREVIQKWGLDKNIGKGRVYRLVHDDFKAGSQPRMLDETTQQLVAHLSHPNGWWRDTAQKLIILREDRDSVVPMLEEMAQKDASELGRLHALWTLEGIGKLSSDLVNKSLRDPASIVRTSAIRMAEPFMKAGDTQIVATFSGPLPNDQEMVVQLLNSISASHTSNADLLAVIEKIEKEHGNDEVIREVLKVREAATRDAKLAAANKLQGEQFSGSMERGKVIYQQLCFSCHGEDGKGAPLAGSNGDKLAPSFIGSHRILGTGESAVR
ncbi:MAG: c-type cytochrome, partial [Akkermansiaceae bacterium]|nr:c-type cytochrome [Akkermansiaceae bacterium]